MNDIEVSPMARDSSEIPEISFADFLLDHLKTHLPAAANKPWMVDVNTGRQVLFGEIEVLSGKIASALTKLGLGRGDSLFYMTYDVTYVNLVLIAAWRLGIAVRGCFQKEKAEVYERQLREGKVAVVLLDSETAPTLKKAVQSVEWQVKLINVGFEPVPDATPYEELIQDNGSAFTGNVKVDPREDVLYIPNTSGSTGMPKGALHTHYSAVAVFYNNTFLSKASIITSQLIASANYIATYFVCTMLGIFNSLTVYSLPKYSREEYFGNILKYKPMIVLMYPYIATWFARDPELEQHDLSFLKLINIVGSNLDHTTSNLISSKLPETLLSQGYGLSEVLGGISTTIMENRSLADAFKPLKTFILDGKTCVTSGKLSPYATAKIIDPDTKLTLGRMKLGEILVRAPYIMKGYLVQNAPPDRRDIDSDGWFHTGDLGFFDDEGYLYVQERKSFLFKYYMHFVSPSTIEAVLSEHEAVQEVGVVGVPNAETTKLARAFVVLKPGTHATVEDLKSLVAQKLPNYLHLHGGVRFVDALPVNRGGKLDRVKLRQIADGPERKHYCN